MTEESNETVERLVCPMGHMAKPDSDLEEGDECPHHDYCPQDNKMKNREISRHRLELKDKLHSNRRFGGRELDIHDSLELTPGKAVHEAEFRLSSYHNLSDFVYDLDPSNREHIAETLEVLHKLGYSTETTQQFVENPWAICFECGKVCKNNDGRKIHKSKKHRRSFL